MKREIKFRAWHVTAKEMLHSAKQSNIFQWLEEGQQVKIMQFTGLKDKNGVDVYESDIVYWKHMDLYGVVYYHENDVIFLAKPINGEDGIDSYLDSTHMEVVGNIHSNPELLK